jgi:hypothetical protein
MGEGLEDLVLGRLAWDEEMDWWVGELDLFPGHQIEVFVEFYEEAGSREVVVSRAREWVARVRRREPEYRAWSAARLVEGRWNQDEPMTAADIERLLRLASLECSSDGSARVYWEDEDVLFYGHGFYTQLDAGGECVETAMAQVAAEDEEARLLWSLRQGRDELGPAKVTVARIADRALKGSQSAIEELASELQALGHPEAERVRGIRVECPAWSSS